VYTFGDVSVDLGDFTASRNGVSLSLSPREFDILRYMLENRNRVISRAEMLSHIWGYGEGLQTRTIDSHIANLRHKIEKVPSEPEFIHTVHRIGYRFKC
jgi:two-component system alkaline phosphatase synthesis response regulator PhoP